MRLRRTNQKGANGMFLGFLGKMFSGSQSSGDYPQLLFDEFIRTKNVNSLCKVMDEYKQQYQLSDEELLKENKKAVHKIGTYLKSKKDILDTELEAYRSFVLGLAITNEEKQHLLKMAFNKPTPPVPSQKTIATPIPNPKSPAPSKKVVAAPIPGPNQVSLPIVLKNGEQVQYRAKAIYLKKTKKTVGVNFAGPVVSFRICKGVRYRLGSMSVQRQTLENYDRSDQGIFYITNKRIGYFGQKQFSFDLKKLVSIQNGDAGLLIYKDGRENPFMIALDNYDAPCEIISNLLNQ